MITRTINGQLCTDRAGLVEITGRPLNSLNVLAKQDPRFPKLVSPQRLDRKYWYALNDAYDYKEALAARRQVLKPPAIGAGGDLDELLRPR